MTNDNKWPLILGSIMMAIIGAYGFLAMRDQRTAPEKMEEAIQEFRAEAKATEQQQKDRTTDQRADNADKDHAAK